MVSFRFKRHRGVLIAGPAYDLFLDEHRLAAATLRDGVNGEALLQDRYEIALVHDNVSTIGGIAAVEAGTDDESRTRFC